MNKIARNITSGLIIALVFVFGLQAVNASAAAEPGPRESITLSPANKRYVLDAGSTKTDEMTIVNDGQVAYDFILYARPYGISSSDSTYASPDFMSTAKNADAYQWVQFNQSRYHIEPGQTVKAGYTVRVPAGAAPGGHYGVLFAETQASANETQSSAVARKKRVGMIVYATVNGDYKMSGKTLGSNIPFLQFHAPLHATNTVQNDGNSDFVVKSTFKVNDLFGGTKFSQEKEFSVLPQTKRELSFDWDGAPWFGLYKTQVHTSFLDHSHSASGYVLLVPRWLLILLAVAVCAGGLYAVVLRRR